MYMRVLQPDACGGVPAGLNGTGEKVLRNNPVWRRIQVRTDRVEAAVGLRFREFDTTIADTVEALVAVGGSARGTAS